MGQHNLDDLVDMSIRRFVTTTMLTRHEHQNALAELWVGPDIQVTIKATRRGPDARAEEAADEPDPPGIATVTPTRQILTAQERHDFEALKTKAQGVANGLDRWMQDHLASAFPPDEEGS